MNKSEINRINTTFNRFPMLTTRIVKILLNNGGDMELSNFLKELEVPREWFMDKCKNLKAYNTVGLKDIGIFDLYSVVSGNRKIEKIKLTDEENWKKPYIETSKKILKE